MFRVSKKVGGRPIAVNQEKREQGDLLLTGVHKARLYSYSSYPLSSCPWVFKGFTCALPGGAHPLGSCLLELRWPFNGRNISLGRAAGQWDGDCSPGGFGRSIPTALTWPSAGSCIGCGWDDAPNLSGGGQECKTCFTQWSLPSAASARHLSDTWGCRDAAS